MSSEFVDSLGRGCTEESLLELASHRYIFNILETKANLIIKKLSKTLQGKTELLKIPNTRAPASIHSETHYKPRSPASLYSEPLTAIPADLNPRPTPHAYMRTDINFGTQVPYLDKPPDSVKTLMNVDTEKPHTNELPDFEQRSQTPE